MIRILAACSPGEVRIAVERDATLVDYALWRPGAPDGTGDIVSGVVQTWNPAMGGAFIALPGNSSGFLPTKDSLPEGQRIIVRITRAAQGGKGVRLTRAEAPSPAAAGNIPPQPTSDSLPAGMPAATRATPGRNDAHPARAKAPTDPASHAPGHTIVPPTNHASPRPTDDTHPAGARTTHAEATNPTHHAPGNTIALLQRGPSPLEIMAARYPDAEIVVDAPAIVAALPRALRPRITRSLTCAFDAALEAEVEALGASEVTLTGNMRATIDPTTALVAIDLDWSGTGGAQAQFAANTQAFPEIAAQIRLRSLSGAILIDPAGLGTRKRQALVAPMRAALADDPQNAECLGATGLGLLEIVRTRTAAPLHELLRSPHGIGLEALRQTLRTRPTGGITPSSVHPTGIRRPIPDQPPLATSNPAKPRGTTPPEPDMHGGTHRRGTSPTLRVSLPVAHALEADPQALATFATEYGAPLRLLPDPDYPTAYWSFAP